MRLIVRLDVSMGETSSLDVLSRETVFCKREEYCQVGQFEKKERLKNANIDDYIAFLVFWCILRNIQHDRSIRL